MDLDLLRRRLELMARLLETAAAQSHKRLQKIDDAQQILADVLKSLPAPGNSSTGTAGVEAGGSSPV